MAKISIYDIKFIKHVATIDVHGPKERVFCDGCEKFITCGSEDDLLHMYVVRAYWDMYYDACLCEDCFKKSELEDNEVIHNNEAIDWMDEHYPED